MALLTFMTEEEELWAWLVCGNGRGYEDIRCDFDVG